MSAVLTVPEVRAFQAGDYVALHDQIERASGVRLVPDPWQVGMAYEQVGPAFTAATEAGPLGSAGLHLLWPGRAAAWAILSPGLRRDTRMALWFTAALKRRLRELVAEHDLRRIEADVWATNGTGVRWVRALGFQIEAEMPLYGPHGEPAFRFVLLRRG